jgi:hypothetical protein
MKLIFDQNLSSDLVRQLAALFPGSVHVAGAKRGGAKSDMGWSGVSGGAN